MSWGVGDAGGGRASAVLKRSLQAGLVGVHPEDLRSNRPLVVRFDPPSNTMVKSITCIQGNTVLPHARATWECWELSLYWCLNYDPHPVRQFCRFKVRVCGYQSRQWVFSRAVPPAKECTNCTAGRGRSFVLAYGIWKAKKVLPCYICIYANG